MAPLLGWVSPQDRTQEQNDTHEAAVKKMPRFTLPPQDLAAGEKVILSDFWNNPEVVADTGMSFDRSPFHQLTGSCVGAGGGNALFTLICVQRMLSQGATKAFIPFWPFDYGRCRYNEGDRGQGEGAMGSSFADTLVKEGVIASTEPGLPQFTNGDGLVLTESLEMKWSDGGSSLVTGFQSKAKQYPLGSATEIKDVSAAKATIINGYPLTFACDNYIGDASPKGSGSDVVVCGRWGQRGGHQQWVFGYYVHPTLGPMFAVGNNWPRSTYPKDQYLPLVCCWVLENDFDYALQNLSAEVYGLSHLAYIEVQPSIIHYLV